MGKVVSVKASGRNANPEFAKKLEKSLEEILRGEYVTLEEVLEEEDMGWILEKRNSNRDRC